MSEHKKVRPRWKIVLRWLLWVLLVQLLLVNVSASFYAYRLTHFYSDSTLLTAKPSNNVFVKTWKLFTGPKQVRSFFSATPHFPVESVQLSAKNGLRIDAWYSTADSMNKGTVILFHGIGTNKCFLIDEASEFRYRGYNVMMVDFRAHGKSEGNATSLGVKETEEVELAYSYALQRGAKNIYLYGISFGAVVVARAVDEYQLKTSGLILEMPFASLQTFLRNKARLVGFVRQQGAFAFLTGLWIGIEQGYNGFGHKTTRYVKNTQCPVLVQWGARDEFVLREEIDAVYEAIGSVNKRLVVYDNAGHGSLQQKNPMKWGIEIDRFLQQQAQ